MTVSPVSKQAPESRNLANKNIFEDPAIAAAAQNDPFARWMSKNWKVVAVMLVAVAVSMIGYNQYTSIAAQKKAEATESLNEIQSSYDELVAKEGALAALQTEKNAATDAKVKEDTQKKIDESQKEISSLRDKLVLMTDALVGPKPFNLLASMYKGLMFAQTKEFDKAQAVLAQVSWETVGKPNSPERMSAELVTFAIARSLLDSPSHVVFARDQLTGLAERGTFAAVQAGNAVRLVAQTDAEKQKANEIATSLISRFPAQMRFISGMNSEER